MGPGRANSLLQVLRHFAEALGIVRTHSRGETAPRQSTGFHGPILDSLGFYVAAIDRQGKITTVNSSWSRSGPQDGFHLGAPLGPGTDYPAFCRTSAAAGIQPAAEALAGLQGVLAGSIPSYEFSYLSPPATGKRRYMMTVTPLSTSSGGAVITLKDVSAIEQTELHLKETEDKFRIIADEAPVMIWMAGADKACVHVNKRWLNFTGRRLDQELGDGWIQAVHPDNSAGVLSAYCEAFRKRESFRLEYRLQRADGVYRWVEHNAVPRFDAEGGFAGMIGVCMDITDRRAIVAALDELSGRFIDAHEGERSRIARDLHDNLSQEMALLAIEIGQLEESASKSDLKISENLHVVLVRVQEVSAEIHRLAYELHPSKLDRLGLAAASLSLCEEIGAKQSILVECAFKNIPESLPQNISLCLYRVLQESLQNVTRHSGARRAWVEFRGSAKEIRLSVIDEGVGFNPNVSPKSEGLGLLSMRERLRLVGGRISIESRPLWGTRITATVPLTSAAMELPHETRQAAREEGKCRKSAS